MVSTCHLVLKIPEQNYQCLYFDLYSCTIAITMPQGLTESESVKYGTILIIWLHDVCSVHWIVHFENALYYRAQELCESQCGPPGFPIYNGPYDVRHVDKLEHWTMLFTALVWPHLEFGNVVWVPRFQIFNIYTQTVDCRCRETTDKISSWP